MKQNVHTYIKKQYWIQFPTHDNYITATSDAVDRH